MKVGLITMHNVCNYGAVLQTYALQEVIKSINGTCQIVNYVPPVRRGLRQYFPQEYLPFYREIMSWIKWLPVRISWQDTFKTFISKYFVNITPTYYLENIHDLSDSYDAIVTGSDQVWNPNSTRGIDRAYYLNFVNNKTRKISYAASISSINYDEDEDKKINQLLCDFSYISVREKSIIPELETITHKKISHTIDPTVLVGLNFWKEFSQTNRMSIEGEYCLYYILGESKNSLEYGKDYCNSNGLQSVKISFTKRKEADIVLKNPSPENFVSLFLNASFVVTNSLHGCLFSLVAGKSFAIPQNVISGTRFRDLIETYNLEKYETIDNKNKMLVFNPNYTEVFAHIDNMRKYSYNYLYDSLNSCEEGIIR